MPATMKDDSDGVTDNQVAITKTTTKTTTADAVEDLNNKAATTTTTTTTTTKETNVTAAVTTTVDETTQPGETSEDDIKEPIEYNPRWMGYTLIACCSLLNYVCISTIPSERTRDELFVNMNTKRNDRLGAWPTVFGVITFIIPALILIQDRSQSKFTFIKQFHYTKVKQGYFEGSILLFMVLWWIIGVAIITKPGGIAYQASNIYYSSWMTLFLCIYTLNLWSGPSDKDILCINEIVGVSYTLKSWWIHFLSSCVVFGCSIHLHIRISYYSDNQPDTPFAIILGLVSMVVSLFHILVHYNVFTDSSNNNNTTGGSTSTMMSMNIQEGGLFELLCSFFLILVWIVGVAVLTADNQLAATMEGSECKSDFSSGATWRSPSYNITDQNCTIILYYENLQGQILNYTVPCTELPRDIPGSNLYYGVWVCLLSSIDIALKWKAAQALRFASQSQTHTAAQETTTTGVQQSAGQQQQQQIEEQ